MTSWPKTKITPALASRELPARWRLVVVSAGAPVSYSLPTSGSWILGRTPECDVVIDHPSVSRRHAKLLLGGVLRVEDLGSSNGTFVEGESLARGELRELGPGVSIRLGAAVLVLQSEQDRISSERLLADAPVLVSAGMRELVSLLEQTAVGNISILIQGETGVGKEVVARMIHERSPRAKKPFISLNGASLGEALLESELFGHEKGAFTGADSSKPGLLEEADGGTFFLDEVGDLPAGVQAKLLRAFEERRFTRVGGTKPRSVDVRFVSATNRDLQSEVQAQRFRADLYFRLNAMTLWVPPLRERIEDIAPLCEQFIQRFCREVGRARTPELTADARRALERRWWPGNVRELRNAVERAVLLAGNGPLRLEHLPAERRLAAPPQRIEDMPTVSFEHEHERTSTGSGLGLSDELRALERARIIQALEACAGNQTRAAERLGLTRRALVVRLDTLRLQRPRRKP